MVKCLVEELHCDASVKMDYIGMTALHFAAQDGHLDIVRYFIVEKKMDPF